MPNLVKCLVEECHYNESFECHADNIEVRSAGDRVVSSSIGTCCETFKTRAETVTHDLRDLEPDPPKGTRIE